MVKFQQKHILKLNSLENSRSFLRQSMFSLKAVNLVQNLNACSYLNIEPVL